MKPDGCRCEGDTHKSMYCFVTKPEHPTVGELLRSTGHGSTDFDKSVRSALMELAKLKGHGL